ncbi:MAG: hypothetical protein MI750_05005 [Xanthomonadales bacterium]|nr:hypothetical protein [Xanthomonadales bacterium]
MNYSSYFEPNYNDMDVGMCFGNSEKALSFSRKQRFKFVFFGLVLTILVFLKQEQVSSLSPISVITVYVVTVAQFLFFLALDTAYGFKNYVIQNLKVIVSLVWIIGCFWLLFLNFDCLLKLQLNELGDFLAGAFGPLAFFWLVEGHLLQERLFRFQERPQLSLQVSSKISSVTQNRQTLEVCIHNYGGAATKIGVYIGKNLAALEGCSSFVDPCREWNDEVDLSNSEVVMQRVGEVLRNERRVLPLLVTEGFDKLYFELNYIMEGENRAESKAYELRSNGTLVRVKFGR